MTNADALEILYAKRSAVNQAINGLERHRREEANWLGGYKAGHLDDVRGFAATVGADLTTWTGLDA
jgi:hypothetical protein